MLVILELDIAPLNSFIDVFFLLQCEHVLVKLLLKLLIRIIDTQLLERVLGENLKAKDVQKSNELHIILFLRTLHLSFSFN